jgi:hypothetical protein
VAFFGVFLAAFRVFLPADFFAAFFATVFLPAFFAARFGILRFFRRGRTAATGGTISGSETMPSPTSGM